MLDLSTLRAAETMPLVIRHPITGDPTDWVWTITGPGHPQTLAYQERAQRRRLQEERLKEQARINGKKWKGDDRDPDEVRRENMEGVACRVTGFTPAKIDGTDLVFSPEATLKLLLDPNFGWLAQQVLDFLTDDAAFFPRSGEISSTSPSAHSG